MVIIRALSVSVVAVLIAAGPVTAEPPEVPRPNAPLQEILKWFDETTTEVELNLDPLLRQIVCKIGFQAFTAHALSTATGVGEERIWTAVRKLRDMGLVGFDVSHGQLRVIPANKKAGDKMRRWSHDWCVNDDACTVAR